MLDGIRRIVRALRLTAGVAERELGLSGAQLFVLEQLRGGPAGSLEELAARTLTDQSSVSVVVRRLMERGLVSRRRSKEDLRRVELELTAKGRGLAAQAPGTGQARLVSALQGLPPSLRQALAKGLTALVEQMGEADRRAPMFFEDDGSSPRSSGWNRRVRP